MASDNVRVPVQVPRDVWQVITEIRAQLDSLCPGKPTPIEEVLREVGLHYRHCPRTEDELETFCERAKAWK